MEQEVDTCVFQREYRKDGYIRIKVDGIWRFEHVYLIEQYLSISLEPNEVIHHKNGLKSDNRIINLMPFTSQAEHKSFENQVKQFGWTNPLKNRYNNRFKDFMEKRSKNEKHL